MKKSQVYSILILMWLLLLMGSTFTQAATPSYVGINVDNTYEWSTTYDDGPIKDLYEDIEEEGDISEATLDRWKDELATEEDLVKAKIVILDVNDEETDPWGEDGVKIIYNYYLMEEDEEYELEKQDETFAIWDFDEDLYGDHHNFATDEYGIFTYHFFDFRWDSDDNPYPEEDEDYKFLEAENPWFISTKVDWGDIEEELDEEYEDDQNYDDVSVRTDKDKNKIEITLDDDEDDEIEALKWIVQYDNNGVLMYYENQYDGEPIVIVETLVSQIQQFWDAYMIWIIIGAVAIVVVIIIIIVKVKK